MSLLGQPGEATRRQVRILDGVMALRVAAWVAIGIYVAILIHGQAQLAVTLGRAGSALHQTGSALQGLSHLPIVGGRLAKLAVQVVATPISAQTNAATAQTSVDHLAYLLGVVIVVIPAVPALAAYLPFRVARFRETRELRAALAEPQESPYLERYLANRALSTLSVGQLRHISPHPWRDAEEGRLSALAGAELARLGLAPDALAEAAGRGRNGQPAGNGQPASSDSSR